MSKPINKLEFWKERIDGAVKEQYSVYICNDNLWRDIFLAHKKIINDLIPKDAYVLDAGCGYGRMCELFKPQNYEGIDFSPDFIKLATEKYPNHSFEVQDLKKLPYENKQFDWSFCVSIKKMVMDNLGEEEWLKMEKELKRVSKKVLILEYETSGIYEII
jgi:SAM-dependent methyltransferase